MIISRAVRKAILRKVDVILIRQKFIVLELAIFPKNSLLYQCLDLGYAINDFKIEVLLAFAGEG